MESEFGPRRYITYDLHQGPALVTSRTGVVIENLYFHFRRQVAAGNIGGCPAKTVVAVRERPDPHAGAFHPEKLARTLHPHGRNAFTIHRASKRHGHGRLGETQACQAGHLVKGGNRQPAGDHMLVDSSVGKTGRHEVALEGLVDASAAGALAAYQATAIDGIILRDLEIDSDLVV
jgi:hypothetical protein